MSPEIEKEIEAIGLRFAQKGEPCSTAYATIRGRSNPRCWFIPVANRHTTISGLALFQPLLWSATILKSAVIALSFMGLVRVWAKTTVYLKGGCYLSGYFPSIKNPVYAFFTGTESPHRKMAIQIMDDQGGIAGFAKLGTRPGVAALLHHEAAMLQEVASLSMLSANTPKVLYIGPRDEATLLVTDTLKTALSRSPTRLTEAHERFLKELGQKTRQPDCTVGNIVGLLALRIARVQATLTLSPEWQMRLDSALCFLDKYGSQSVSCCMSHGDFTPWNTFMAQGKLYVFDWEYAESNAPQFNDLIHFILNQSSLRSQTKAKQLRALRQGLSRVFINVPVEEHEPLIVLYLLGQVLRQLERITNSGDIVDSWDGMPSQRELLDASIEDRQR